MEPRIIEKDRLVLAGFGFFGDPFQLRGEWTGENEIGRLWQRLMAYLSGPGHSLQHLKRDVAYEVHIEHGETATKGHFEVFVGCEMEAFTETPVELTLKILPPVTYAVFTLHGPHITSDWPRMIYQEWLPGSGYEAAYPYNFQYYDERFKGLENLAESVVDVYVPLKRLGS